jgi:hypothetical protein
MIIIIKENPDWAWGAKCVFWWFASWIRGKKENE